MPGIVKRKAQESDALSLHPASYLRAPRNLRLQTHLGRLSVPERLTADFGAKRR